MDHVQQVLKFLNNAGVSINIKKCEFFTNCLDYLRHFICSRRLEVSTAMLDAVGRLEYPTSLT